MNTDIVKVRVWQLLIVVGPLTTLAVNPWTNFDPISVVKMMALGIISFAILGLLISDSRFVLSDDFRPLFIASLLFIASTFSSFFFSGAPLDQQFWGYFGRNTGVLTYLSLTILLVASATLNQPNFFRSIEASLTWVSIPLGVYCLFQAAEMDPVNWSQFAVFGTLGNVNFLSGFMGLVCVALLARLLSFDFNLLQIGRLFLLFAHLVIISLTESIQGFVIFAVGSIVVLFLRLGSYKGGSIARVALFLLTIIGGFYAIQGLFNKGPLSTLLFQASNVLRADYMHAGWQMTTDHPLFGVGLDSYGDWYREARGEITTLRGSPDRNSNAAHSVFLDVSSNGGFPLLLTYLAILSVIFVRAFKALRFTGKSYDPILVSLFTVWVAFHFQALISINQIGVAIWGWIFGGALFGYASLIISQGSSTRKFDRKKFKGKLLPAKSGLLVFLFAGIGLILSAIPQQADSRYFAATKTGKIDLVEKAATSLGSTAWHRNLLLDNALAAQDSTRARNYAYSAIDRYPRSFWPWKTIWILPDTTDQERQRVLLKLKELDPFNPEFNTP